MPCPSGCIIAELIPSLAGPFLAVQAEISDASLVYTVPGGENAAPNQSFQKDNPHYQAVANRLAKACGLISTPCRNSSCFPTLLFSSNTVPVWHHGLNPPRSDAWLHGTWNRNPMGTTTHGIVRKEAVGTGRLRWLMLLQGWRVFFNGVSSAAGLLKWGYFTAVSLFRA